MYSCYTFLDYTLLAQETQGKVWNQKDDFNKHYLENILCFVCLKLFQYERKLFLLFSIWKQKNVVWERERERERGGGVEERLREGDKYNEKKY